MMNTKPTTSAYLTRRLRTLEEVLANRVMRRQPTPFVEPPAANNDNAKSPRGGLGHAGKHHKPSAA